MKENILEQGEALEYQHIDLEEIINKNSSLLHKTPKFFDNIILKTIEKILCIDKINNFLENTTDLKNIDFIDYAFEFLDFSFSISNKDIKKIPAEGKLVCVANHPLGGLDGLALLKAIYEIRKDVKIVVNDVLLNISNLSDMFLPYGIFSRKTQKINLARIDQALAREEAIVFFPAAEVSRFGLKGIRDKKWHRGAFYFAQKHQAPILPIYINAKNSSFFYIISSILKNFSTLLLPREVLIKRVKRLI